MKKTRTPKEPVVETFYEKLASRRLMMKSTTIDQKDNRILIQADKLKLIIYKEPASDEIRCEGNMGLLWAQSLLANLIWSFHEHMQLPVNNVLVGSTGYSCCAREPKLIDKRLAELESE